MPDAIVARAGSVREYGGVGTLESMLRSGGAAARGLATVPAVLAMDRLPRAAERFADLSPRSPSSASVRDGAGLEEIEETAEDSERPEGHEGIPGEASLLLRSEPLPPLGRSRVHGEPRDALHGSKHSQPWVTPDRGRGSHASRD